MNGESAEPGRDGELLAILGGSGASWGGDACPRLRISAKSRDLSDPPVRLHAVSWDCLS